MGGTSEGAPSVAGVLAQLAGKVAATRGATLGALLANPASYPHGFNDLLYARYTAVAKATSYAGPLFDVTLGSDGGKGCGSLCTAALGYDDITGLGVPVVRNLLASYP